jgi:hypothetical protein
MRNKPTQSNSVLSKIVKLARLSIERHKADIPSISLWLSQSGVQPTVSYLVLGTADFTIKFIRYSHMRTIGGLIPSSFATSVLFHPSL